MIKIYCRKKRLSEREKIISVKVIRIIIKQQKKFQAAIKEVEGVKVNYSVII